MKLLSVIFLACATAVMGDHGLGEPCGPFPGGFCERGLVCIPDQPAVPGGPRHCALPNTTDV